MDYHHHHHHHHHHTNLGFHIYAVSDDNDDVNTIGDIYIIIEMVETCIATLREVTNISGYHLQNR